MRNPVANKRRWSALGALACLLGFASSADAQIFPNLAIKRKLPDCAIERPLFGVYRNQYFGHYPTCWRPFPPGWGTPSPAAPNWQEELKRLPLEKPPVGPGPDEGGAGEGLGVMPGGEPEGGERPDAAEPLPLPEGRAPFRNDLDEPAAEPTPPPGRAPSAPRRPFGLEPQGGAPAGNEPGGLVPPDPETGRPGGATSEYVPGIDQLPAPDLSARAASNAVIREVPAPDSDLATGPEGELEPGRIALAPEAGEARPRIQPAPPAPSIRRVAQPVRERTQAESSERRPGFFSRLFYGRGLKP